MKKIFLILLLLPLFSFAQVKTHWKDARFLAEPMKNILVVSQFYDGEIRAQLEDIMIDALESKGIGAVAASSVLVYDSMYLYSTIERKLDSAGIEGMLIVKMIEERSTDMHILPQELIPPYAYNYYEYYSFYYYHDLPILSDPNYYRRPGRTFRIDAYLYQNKGDMAAWGGQSKSLNPLEPEKAIKKLGKSITKRMLQETVVEAE
ncbi:MAG: hypothetical protein DRJ15_02040 [Bacteroidetes bacterium]|nr:MAG: hypothetical protein DRJ15_02040 [Bacteroidota bacterium]